MAHMHLPDGTYLASDFNYSMPRNRKGYDSVAYKSQGRDDKSDPRFMATFLRENDKGYYSDHTYESPRCELARTAKHGTVGYREINPKEIDYGSSKRNSDSHQNTSSGELTFPRSKLTSNTDMHLGNYAS